MSAAPITITLDGEPIPKARPRFGKGRVFTPAKTKRFERDLGWQAKIAMHGRAPLDGPLKVELVFVLALLESVDLDNLIKSALDALNKIVFRDDAQIVELIARKQTNDAPSTWIRIERVVSFPR